MRIVKYLYQLGYTCFAKIRWKKDFIVSGIFRKHLDTQIIIEDKGHIELGSCVSFQKRVSLTAVGGIFILGIMLHSIEIALSFVRKKLPLDPIRY